MADDTCSIAGCLRRVESRGWCKAHYSRWLRTGNTGDDPLTAEASDVGKCHIDGCFTVSRLKHGLCQMHYKRFQRWGDPYYRGREGGVTRVGERLPGAGYSAVHSRVKALHGSASRHQCCLCGTQAAHWAYDHQDPYEQMSEDGPYSQLTEHYVPMCAQCHKQFDLDFISG